MEILRFALGLGLLCLLIARSALSQEEMPPEHVFWCEAELFAGAGWNPTGFLPASAGESLIGNASAGKRTFRLGIPLEPPFHFWVRVYNATDPRQVLVTVNDRAGIELGKGPDGWEWHDLGEFDTCNLTVSLEGLGQPPWDAILDTFAASNLPDWTPPAEQPTGYFGYGESQLQPDKENQGFIAVGNLSVDVISYSPQGSHPDPAWKPTLPEADYLRKCSEYGVRAYDDYIGWQVIEPEPGQLDFSWHDAMKQRLNEAGMQSSGYPWFHVTPTWLRDPAALEPMRCNAHGEATNQPSIWDPRTLEQYGRLYQEVAAHWGDELDFCYACLLGPYAEGNFPLPYSNFVVDLGHAHEGYWCGDPLAKQAWHNQLRSKYGTVESLNSAWGTDYAYFGATGFPEEISSGTVLSAEQRSTPEARCQWLDFITWYYDSLVQFSAGSVALAAQAFGADRTGAKPGGNSGGINPLSWGTYCPLFVKALAPYHVRLQFADSQGGYFADKWMTTLCKFKQVEFHTEAAGWLDQISFLRRCFSDASCGASGLFTYQLNQHLPAAQRYAHLYTGQAGVTDVACFLPTTWYLLGGDVSQSIILGTALREITDFDVADEVLLAEGLLDQYRVLILLQSGVLGDEALSTLEEWVKCGGLLIWWSGGELSDVSGRPASLLNPVPRLEVAGKSWQELAKLVSTTTSTQIGKGWVLRLPPEADQEALDEVTRLAVYHSDALPGGPRPAPELDSLRDEVWATLFEDKALFLNQGDKPKSVSYFLDGKQYQVELVPYRLVEVPR